ncbi:uncharacterized protein LOC136094823 [Hydra vulgaris]|uniref:uncharacterized protein LOC136094823 n=1 Tax=Hydra vulgaris TaxID=6087 RepID=UPI0032E9D828
MLGECIFCGKQFVNNATCMKQHLVKNCKNVSNDVKQKFNIKGSSFTTKLVAEIAVSSSEDEDDEDFDNGNNSIVSNNSSPVFCDLVDFSVVTPSESSQSVQSSSSVNTTATEPLPSSSLSSVRNLHNIKCWIDTCDQKTPEDLEITFSKAIYGTATAFSIVDNPLWREFFRQLRPAWNPPSRYKLAGPLLKLWHSRIETEISVLIKISLGCVLMSDGWSDVCNDNHIQFLLSTPKPIFLKSFHPENNHHTAEYIFHITNSVIKEIHVKPIAFISDHASNMTKAWKLVQHKHLEIFCYGCGAHALELLATDILKIPSVQFNHLQHKKVSSFFRKKQVLKHVMLEHQMTLKKSKLVCLQSMPTRWSTAFTMIKRNNDLQDVLRISISDVRVYALSAHDKAKLNSVKNTLHDTVSFWSISVFCEKLLAAIQNAVKSAEEDLVPAFVMPRLWNYVANIFKEVLLNSDCEIPQNDIKLITEAVERCRKFSVRDIQKAANLLDPRFMGNDLIESEKRQGLSTIIKVGLEFQLLSGEIMKILWLLNLLR